MRVRLSLKSVRKVTMGLILLALGFSVGYWRAEKTLQQQGKLEVGLPKKLVNTGLPQEYQEVDFSLFWEAWQRLEQTYLDPDKMDPEEMLYGAISGMVASLGDPYTVFLPPVEKTRTEEDLQGSFEGVGVQLGYKDGQLAVVAPLKGMPAELAGVKAGDLILHIKDVDKGVDVDTQGMSLPEAVNTIRGKHGQVVTLTLFRDGFHDGKTFDVDLARDTIVIPTVDLEFLPLRQAQSGPGGGGWTVDWEEATMSGEMVPGPVVAHLALHKFGERTDGEWNETVEEILKREEVEGVVFDLRNNPGGFLDGAVFIASEFIDGGVVVKQQGRHSTETYSVNRKGKLIDKPVVILLNQGSASASEIVAGAMRDRLGTKLVGERSFGKGTVQEREDLRHETGMHVTTARWLLPGGDWIHEEGIGVDVEVTDSAETVGIDEVIEVAVEQL